MTPRLGMLLLAALFSVAYCRAEDKSEADIIAKEEVEAAELDGESNNPLKNFSARGKFTLFAEGDERKTEEVMGEFRTESGSYLVKPMHVATRKILIDHIGKEVTMLGVLRGAGKYFIVEDISGGGAKPVEKRSKRKL